MKLLSVIYQDKELLAKFEEERAVYYALIRKRADVFMAEAKKANLHMLPYIAGFFLSIPTSDPDAVCKKLHDDNIFAVPLAKGIRIAVCAVTVGKITGMAQKIANAIAAVEK